MATVIDALLVTLGLDTKAFVKGGKDAEKGIKAVGKTTEEESRKIAAQTKAMADGFNRVKNEVVSLVAIALGAKTVKDFFSVMVNGQASLARQAKNLGVSARELDAWGAAVETVGGTADGFRGSMQALQGAFTAFSMGKGGGETIAAFRQVGIEIADASGKVRPMRELLLDLADAMQNMAPQKQIVLASMLGLDEGTLNLLRSGRGEVQKIVDQMYQASGVTDKSTEAAVKAQAQWATFRRELFGVGQTIFESLTPALEKSNKGLLSISGWVQTHKGEITGFFDGLGTAVNVVARGIGDVLGFFTKLGERLSMTSVGDKLGEIIAKVAAYGGSKDAQEALARNGVKGYAMPKDAGAPAAAAKPGQTSAPASSGNLPRGVRNNNPGNLNFVGQEGAVREDGPGRFAKFSSMEEGVAALVKQLKLYKARGVDTIQKIVSKYAPASENDVGSYVSALTKATGLKADDKVDLDNTQVLKELIRGITNHENGKGYVSDEQITGGIRIGAGANRAASVQVNNTSSETNINGPITINTQATDAQGISRDLYASLQQRTRMSAAGTGMR